MNFAPEGAPLPSPAWWWPLAPQRALTWTFPNGAASTVVILNSGATASGVNFGWDYQNLP